jgi:hypothetical protein
VTDTDTILTPDQIDERAAIVWSTDDQSCHGCGRSALGCGSASDPRWFIDSEIGGRDAAGEPILLAVIRCPECW